MKVETVNMFVSFGLVPARDPYDDADDVGLCVLTEEQLSHRVATDEYALNRGEEGQLPRSGVFPLDYSVVLATIGDGFDESEEEPDRDEQLVRNLDTQLHDLLDCVYSGRRDWSSFDDGCDDGAEFAVVVAHASGEHQEIGGQPVDELAKHLDETGCQEVLLLACRGGCESMASKLATNGRIVVSPARVVDSRKAYIFAMFYFWKRFGEGWSAAQTLGSQPVAGNDYRLFHEGRSI